MTNLVRVLAAAVCCLVADSCLAEWGLAQMVGRDKSGKPVYRGQPIDDDLRNEWPDEYEREFQERARQVVAANSEKLARGTTYFESEKRLYGRLMTQVFVDDLRDGALAGLQAEDAQAKDWHEHTEGIDYFAAFTLKHQIRKYFYFGDLLEKDYGQRMFRGAKKWTEKDPLRRPHHAYAKQTGWGPNAKNSWVDVRSTENLFLMRVTSVYLMAEETGNRETTEKYKRLLLDYTRTLYRVGIGEWDSENYHGHSLGPLLNLHDFAKDREVQRAAKACLDWFTAAGALKYRRGGFNGPGSRDYNHPQPFGGSAASMLWVYFGDSPLDEHEWESDEIHAITSSYRPPVAVVKLARKEIDLPVEVLASKPPYSATTSLEADAQPDYLETHYLGHTFQMGTLATGTPTGFSSVNGFQILVDEKTHGSRIVHAIPGPDPSYAGSPQYQSGKVAAENRVAQDRNLAVWLAKNGRSPWVWVVPPETKVSEKAGVTFLEIDRTWIAVRPLGTTKFEKDDKLTAQVSEGKKARFPEHFVLAANGTGKNFCGVAVEIGEPQSHRSFDAFRKAVLAAEIDASKLEEGIVTYKATDGKHLGFHWNDDPHDLGNWQNGTRHDWGRHSEFLYTGRGGPAPLHGRWGSGTLYVEAKDEAFYAHVDDEGDVTFESGTRSEIRKRAGVESAE